MAKLKASRLAVAAASEAVQIHGGLGYMLESPVARFYCDAKVLEIGEGTNEIQHVVIAREPSRRSAGVPGSGFEHRRRDRCTDLRRQGESRSSGARRQANAGRTRAGAARTFRASDRGSEPGARRRCRASTVRCPAPRPGGRCDRAQCAAAALRRGTVRTSTRGGRATP